MHISPGLQAKHEGRLHEGVGSEAEYRQVWTRGTQSFIVCRRLQHRSIHANLKAVNLLHILHQEVNFPFPKA